MKFPSQLLAVARLACLARVRNGNVSPITTQANGPLTSLCEDASITGRKRDNVPCHCKGSDEHASSDDHDNAGALVLIGRASNADGGEDEEPGGLPASTNDERDTATDSLDDVEPGEGGDDVHSTKDELYQNGVVNASRLEDIGTVLENVSSWPNQVSKQVNLRRRSS